MAQSDAYKFVNEVNRLADMVGADHARDVLRVYLTDMADSPLDVTAETVPTKAESIAHAAAAGASLGPDEDVNATLSAPGASTLSGRVSRIENAYSVVVKWQRLDGTTLFQDTVASGVTGTTSMEGADALEAIAPAAEVVLTDDSGSAKSATYTFQLR